MKNSGQEYSHYILILESTDWVLPVTLSKSLNHLQNRDNNKMQSCYRVLSSVPCTKSVSCGYRDDMAEALSLRCALGVVFPLVTCYPQSISTHNDGSFGESFGN